MCKICMKDDTEEQMSGAIGSNDQAWSIQFALLEFINEVRRHGTFTARLS